MKKEDVKSYSITENVHSGHELELQFMPLFFMESDSAMFLYLQRQIHTV